MYDIGLHYHIILEWAFQFESLGHILVSAKINFVKENSHRPTYPVLVNYVDDNAQFALIMAIHTIGYTPNLHKA